MESRNQEQMWNGLQIECNGGRNLNINLQRCCCCASRSTPVVLSIVTRSQPSNMHSNIQSKVFLSCSYWGICRYHVIKVMLMFTATTLAEFWWHQYNGNLKIYIRLDVCYSFTHSFSSLLLMIVHAAWYSSLRSFVTASLMRWMIGGVIHRAPDFCPCSTPT